MLYIGDFFIRESVCDTFRTKIVAGRQVFRIYAVDRFEMKLLECDRCGAHLKANEIGHSIDIDRSRLTR